MQQRERPVFGLVLTGGGARGAYQAGVLARVAEGVGGDFPFPVITGVSAGAINASGIACHRGTLEEAVSDLTRAWLRLTTENVFRADFTALGGSLARWIWLVATGGLARSIPVRSLLDTRPLRRYLAKALDLAGIRDNIRSGRLRALALSATSYNTGNTVTFVEGVQGLTPWERARRIAVLSEITLDHLMASAALPLVFPAVLMGGDAYGDGSIRQASPLAPAIHLGADRILTISVRYPRIASRRASREAVPYPPPAQVLGMMMHGVFLDALENDIERLERINRTLALLPATTRHPEGLRAIEMLVLRPSRDLGELATGTARHLPRPLRVLARGLGASRTEAPDFLSYLVFEPPFLERLIELGYQDARARWDDIARFLDP